MKIVACALVALGAVLAAMTNVSAPGEISAGMCALNDVAHDKAILDPRRPLIF